MLIDKTKGRTAMLNSNINVQLVDNLIKKYNDYMTVGLQGEVTQIIEDVNEGYFLTEKNLQEWATDFDTIQKVVNDIIEKHEKESAKDILKAILLNMPEQYKLNNSATAKLIETGECDILDYEYNNIIVTVGILNNKVCMLPDVECYANNHVDYRLYCIGSIKEALKQV